MILRALVTLLLSTQYAFAYNWGEGELLPKQGLPNPLELSNSELRAHNRAGRFYALQYPVSVTGALIPYRPIKNILNRRLNTTFETRGRFSSFDDFLKWLGLNKFPETEGVGAYFVPFTLTENEILESLPDRMGLSIGLNEDGAQAMTFSCAACHSTQLFGKIVMGLQNRFPNANRLYSLGDRTLSNVPTPVFKALSGATEAEAKMYRRTRKNMRFVESRKPQALGLDTSLSHTALSLSHRKLDEVASKSKGRRNRSRAEPLRTTPADSKPGTWWNVKYKNKWLLDGSLVSGNPIFTNILWNEIGRGTDLQELEVWLNENQSIVDELTAAVYNSEAPHITDFLDVDEFDLKSAQRGQKLFKKLSCNKCHGDYEKNWDTHSSLTLTKTEQLKTFKVQYHEDTPVKDVGTDPYRYQAMKSLLQLNDLQISKKNGAIIKVQKGYVPPPLVGIWARWPYFHNNSIPSLCAVLTPENMRPDTYWAGMPIKKDRDFDWDCNGYPQGDKVPKHWKKRRGAQFRTHKKGLSNSGHSERILVKDGKPRFTTKERLDLVRFLQTL